MGVGTVAGAGGEEEFDPALEGGDDDGDKTLYCFCQRVSFGEMIACDAPDCEHEWVRRLRRSSLQLLEGSALEFSLSLHMRRERGTCYAWN